MAIASAFRTIPAKIIIAPLNWGLGHATRCIPIIDFLLAKGTEVILASDGNALEFLQRKYPGIKTYSLPSYDISYTQKKIEHSMLLQSPKIVKAILAEKEQAKKIAEIEKPDVILSDNRLGFRVEDIRSIYMTHQITLVSNSTVFSRLGSKVHKSYIEKFDTCWIPDLEGSMLSGKMSSGVVKIPKQYLGCLSHMQKSDGDRKKEYDNLVILSGPEPQRTRLENILTELLAQHSSKSLMVRGLVKEDNAIEHEGNLEKRDYLLSTELGNAIAMSKNIICRAGYSSIMDLHILNRKAILIPTPGQTEQEYLAERAEESGRHICILQKNLRTELFKFLIPSLGYARDKDSSMHY